MMVNFLNFLERDLLAHPENIRPVTASSFAEAERLTAGIEVDLEEALEEDEHHEGDGEGNPDPRLAAEA